MSILLTIPDAEILLFEGIHSPLFGSTYFEELHQGISWHTESITLYGKSYLQPRLIEFYGEQGIEYKYSKKIYTAVPWTDLLLRLRDIASEVAQAPFNCMLANLYRNERDSMGFHADDEPELGDNPTIVSMSFGATRTFVLKHRHRREIQNVRIPLTSESILVMKGATQANWLHGIGKKKRTLGPRINLTFRHVKHYQ
ncbi:MAG: alpha-ketoglutarate-dependent dioxygenase AlkB [Ignavibacteria bacterium]|nr:alpha-ketoglutarate-dependent dioxygenase AlkB [Ignavibacteria bacterium]